jgi:ribosomal protein S18 acetylase RimI-like enzyme
MPLTIRPMTASDCEAVAAFVHALAVETMGRAAPKLTAESLKEQALGDNALIDVVVAEEAGMLAGACLTLMTYSTWRGAKGLYVVDLFVDPARRGGKIGERLLRESARRGAASGATFVKLEVDTLNGGAAKFYKRLGFQRKEDDRLFVLEPDEFKCLVSAIAP